MVSKQAKKPIVNMSVLNYLDYFLRNSGTVEASEVTHLGEAVNPALLRTGFTKTTALERNQKDVS